MTTTVLISGGNRGIGLGILEKYAARDDHTVITTALDPENMPEVKTGKGSKVMVVYMDQSTPDGTKKALEEIKSKGITKLDIVVCSAAIMLESAFAPIREIPLDAFEQHWRVNVYGHLNFFQACRPLLQPGSKFIHISSGAGVIDRMPMKQNTCYGITKAGTMFLAHFAHFEEPDLTIFPIAPGWVRTDMGKRSAALTNTELGSDKLIDIETSTSGIVQVIDASTRETHGGQHWNYDGSKLKW